MAAARGNAKRSRVGAIPAWRDLDDRDLLEVRLCDLGLAVEDTPLARRIDRLEFELRRRGLRFRPYTWLSTDWFTPDGATGFAIPFYLADPRLQRLEQKQMLEVEGGTEEWCMRIMRHETAHAIDNAYRLHWRKSWREVFGKFSRKYESSYTPDPTSRDYVQNLPHWYSQSHPAEDWAETFAVWLQPGNRWRNRYAGWPALKKLEFVDGLMREIATKPKVVRSRYRDEPLRDVKMTLREYYDRKRQHYTDEATPAFDGQLRRIFEVCSDREDRVAAATFLRRNRRKLVRHVSTTTGQNAYLVDHVVTEMARRARSLGFCVRASEADALLDTSILLTSLTMQFLHGGHPRYHR